jgi:phage I-like protein
MQHLLAFICKELAGGVPEEIQVIPYGVEISTPKGPFTLDEENAPVIVREFEGQKNQMVIDYEHQTLSGAEAPAAGWVTRLINRGKDGIWAAVEWTERAKQYLANREYRYVSPVFLKRISDNRVLRLINVALTNQPNIDGMVPLVNKSGFYFEIKEKEESIMWKELLKLLGLAETATEQDAITAVNKLKESSPSGQGEPSRIVANKTVLTALGLKEGAGETEVTGAIAAMKQSAGGGQIVANKAVLTALGLKEGATEAEVTGTIMAMKQSHDQVGTLSGEVKALKERLEGKEAADVVAMAMKEGKITPAQKEWADEYAKRDLAGFKVFVAKAPTVVVMGKVVGEDKPGEGGIDELQAQVNKQMGVDPETFKKYNK